MFEIDIFTRLGCRNVFRIPNDEYLNVVNVPYGLTNVFGYRVYSFMPAIYRNENMCKQMYDGPEVMVLSKNVVVSSDFFLWWNTQKHILNVLSWWFDCFFMIYCCFVTTFFCFVVIFWLFPHKFLLFCHNILAVLFKKNNWQNYQFYIFCHLKILKHSKHPMSNKYACDEVKLSQCPLICHQYPLPRTIHLIICWLEEPHLLGNKRISI